MEVTLHFAAILLWKFFFLFPGDSDFPETQIHLLNKFKICRVGYTNGTANFLHTHVDVAICLKCHSVYFLRPHTRPLFRSGHIHRMPHTIRFMRAGGADNLNLAEECLAASAAIIRVDDIFKHFLFMYAAKDTLYI
jgi:hypothetical protein